MIRRVIALAIFVAFIVMVILLATHAITPGHNVVR